MTSTAYLLVSAICFCVSFTVSHIVFVRLYVSRQPLLSGQVAYFWFFIVYFLLGLVAFSVLHLTHLTTEDAEFFTAIFIFCIINIGFCYVYFHIYNMSQTATRINIMVDLLCIEQKDRSLALNERIGVKMIENRIERLKVMKQLAVDDNGVVAVVSGKFLLIGKLLSFLGSGIAGKNRY